MPYKTSDTTPYTWLTVFVTSATVLVVALVVIIVIGSLGFTLASKLLKAELPPLPHTAIQTRALSSTSTSVPQPGDLEDLKDTSAEYLREPR